MTPLRGGVQRSWAILPAALALTLAVRRAEGKGCFLGAAEVTMADGSRKQLQHVQIGDVVKSWDEDLDQLAFSEVKAVPHFERDRAELVEIGVANASFQATVDHPFWSKSQESLVSFHPSMTKELYDLDARLVGSSEEFHGESGEAVPVSFARRLAPAGEGLLFLQKSPRDPVKVTTLCLEPHHWYYVHGVRVHNKGCFVAETAVTMADGTRKQIKDVAVGDEVASWDEDLQKPVPSTVSAVLTYKRGTDELVEIVLPSTTLHATVDHPFWSKGQQKLVSLHPNGTLEQYELEAQLMSETEEFEGEKQESVRAAAVRRSRKLGLALAQSAPRVEVMTLCLDPHHWFYAEGVRVHNKGCFAPWTPVLMEDGSHRQIGEVREGDVVASWDDEGGKVAPARVVGLDSWPPWALLEVRVGPAGADRPSQARFLSAVPEGNASASASLVVTPDHPIFSARQGGLVSMRPELTLERYGLPAAQMQTQELLHHYLNGTVSAEIVGDWEGQRPDRVITLRLDQHHWFYANGVRVHNKGSTGGGYSSGGSKGSSSGFGGGATSYNRATVGAAAFAGYALAYGGSRRRYGTYRDEESQDGGGNCEMESESTIRSSCSSRSPSSANDTEYCDDCIACETDSCIKAMETRSPSFDCEEFLGEVYKECTEESSPVGVIIFLVVFVGLCGVCCAFYYFKTKSNNAISTGGGGAAAIHSATQSRNDLHPSNGPQLQFLQFRGTYSENGDTKPTSYTINFKADGTFSGSTTDDDGTANIFGKLNWQYGAPGGAIAWQETRPGVTIEASGFIESSGAAYVLRGHYVSTYGGTTGSLDLRSEGPPAGQQTAWGAPMGAPVANPAPVVMGQVVGASPAVAPLPNRAAGFEEKTTE